MALDLTAGRRGHHALARVIERWVRHLLNVDVEVEALTEVQDANLTWYVGLDAEGTRIGDLLWNGEPLDEPTSARVAALYRLRFLDPAEAAEADERRAGLSHSRDDAGQGAANKAAESGDRSSDPSFGGSELSAASR